MFVSRVVVEGGLAHVLMPSVFEPPCIERGKPRTQKSVIERATNGAVTRAELRPDDYWLIWPDLPAPERPTPEKEAADA